MSANLNRVKSTFAALAPLAGSLLIALSVAICLPNRIGSLQFGELPTRCRIVGKLVVEENSFRNDVGRHIEILQHLRDELLE